MLETIKFPSTGAKDSLGYSNGHNQNQENIVWSSGKEYSTQEYFRQKSVSICFPKRLVLKPSEMKRAYVRFGTRRKKGTKILLYPTARSWRILRAQKMKKRKEVQGSHYRADLSFRLDPQDESMEGTWDFPKFFQF